MKRYGTEIGRFQQLQQLEGYTIVVPEKPLIQFVAFTIPQICYIVLYRPASTGYLHTFTAILTYCQSLKYNFTNLLFMPHGLPPQLCCHATSNLLLTEIPLVFMIETCYTNSLQLLKHLDARDWCLQKTYYKCLTITKIFLLSMTGKSVGVWFLLMCNFYETGVFSCSIFSIHYYGKLQTAGFHVAVHIYQEPISAVGHT